MAKKVRRIIIDTNIWISFLITKDFSQLDKDIFSGRSILIISQKLLDEFLEVIGRPKFKKYFTKDDIISVLSFIDDHADFFQVSSTIDVCRDKKDNFLLSLAVDSQADF
ncbi:Hypothetical protein C900_01624 [Fulvivirga imtechensis AK7]|uniref:PIN domain-containing protein n=1 Tax=Fulvivirga imtechensis AK7 TaxID=1237149 RepID=L8JYR0_9BACT|nr:putative toxin-antitoxin system toxin component, PIN family [Fulvivirga imtechensis]ELR72342.1 Hypothetical protein C900_01624 [Fulvivirga imtechensis AK7]